VADRLLNGRSEAGSKWHLGNNSWLVAFRLPVFCCGVRSERITRHSENARIRAVLAPVQRLQDSSRDMPVPSPRILESIKGPHTLAVVILIISRLEVSRLLCQLSRKVNCLEAQAHRLAHGATWANYARTVRQYGQNGRWAASAGMPPVVTGSYCTSLPAGARLPIFSR
jgi:hypothetical protein